MKTSKSLLIVSLFSTLVFAFCSCSSNDQLPVLDLSEDLSHDKIEAIDNWLGELQSQQKFNGGVLIAQDGQALLQKTYGYVDATLTTKLTKSSMFRLASLSKQFTAMGIMILKEKGKLDQVDAVATATYFHSCWGSSKREGTQCQKFLKESKKKGMYSVKSEEQVLDLLLDALEERNGLAPIDDAVVV